MSTAHISLYTREIEFYLVWLGENCIVHHLVVSTPSSSSLRIDFGEDYTVTSCSCPWIIFVGSTSHFRLRHDRDRLLWRLSYGYLVFIVFSSSASLRCNSIPINTDKTTTWYGPEIIRYLHHPNNSDTSLTVTVHLRAPRVLWQSFPFELCPAAGQQTTWYRLEWLSLKGAPQRLINHRPRARDIST
jgi:hypothetical protein